MTHQGCLGVLVPAVGGFYVSSLLRGIQWIAQEQRYRIILIQTRGPHLGPHFHQRLLAARCCWAHIDGWITIADAVPESSAHYFEQSGKPVVAISGGYAQLACPIVQPDNVSGMQSAVEHLIDHGHRRIAFAGWFEQHDIRKRFEGYCAALAARALPFDEQLVLRIQDNTGVGGKQAADLLLQRGLPCSAVATATDLNAINMVKELQLAGVAVPEQIAVTGFDNIELCQAVTPPLTSVHQPLEEIGARAARELGLLLAGHPTPHEPVYVPTQLIARRSCGCPPLEPHTDMVIARRHIESLSAIRTELDQNLMDNQAISLELADATPGKATDFSWLRFSGMSKACLGLWTEQQSDPILMTRCYDQHGPLDEQELALSATAFPPASFLETSDPEQLILVIPMIAGKHELGMLALAGNLARKDPGAGGLLVEQWTALLSAAVERESLYQQLNQRAQELESSHSELIRSNTAYARFVPREFLQHMGKQSILDVELGDNVQKEMTILFADIRSFTSFSEEMTPAETFNFLNSYLSRINPVIDQHGGFIDKYIGDAVMALFPESPEDAIRAAIKIIETVAIYNGHRQSVGYTPIRIGIGIHTGTLMLGTIGGAQRMEGTVISDAVNIASRIQDLTKIYEANILVSEPTLSRIGSPTSYNQRYLGNVHVRGKRELVPIYEVFDGLPPRQIAVKIKNKTAFEKGLKLYYRGRFAEACVRFNQVVRRDQHDQAAQFYLQRAAHFMLNGTPPDWERTGATL